MTVGHGYTASDSPKLLKTLTSLFSTSHLSHPFPTAAFNNSFSFGSLALKGKEGKRFWVSDKVAYSTLGSPIPAAFAECEIHSHIQQIWKSTSSRCLGPIRK